MQYLIRMQQQLTLNPLLNWSSDVTYKHKLAASRDQQCVQLRFDPHVTHEQLSNPLKVSHLSSKGMTSQSKP